MERHRRFWAAAAVLVYQIIAVSASIGWPGERGDAMGTYFLMNRYQCERLCWYRKLCKTYSYIYNRTLATDGNCVLHADNIATDTTSAVSTAWIEREAFWDQSIQANGCRNRTCNETEVCVSTFASPFYKCLAFAAVCQAPSRDDGVYRDVTLVQGQRTEFTCNPSLVWAPRHADKTVTCQVTGKYSGLTGTCKNATYYWPSIPFNKPLPDVVGEGWEACFKGNFSGLARMNFNFIDNLRGSCDRGIKAPVYLSFDFSREFKGRVNTTSWTSAVWNQTASLCSWTLIKPIGPFLLDRGPYFEITLRALDSDVMEIVFKNSTPLRLDLKSNSINVTGATYMEVLRDVSLFHVDLGRGCQ